MKISIVVICFNSLGNLSRLLESLSAAMEGVGYEVVITDNGSNDGTEEFIRANYPEANYSRLDRNRGVAYARNRAIERASGDLVWILDDDTIINARAVRDLLGYMAAHPECGISACALFSPTGQRQRSYKPYPGLWLKICNVSGIADKDPFARQVAAGKPFEPVYVIGACQMVRRELFNQIGLLDEKIFYGPEDADFCLRARKKGWHIAYLPATAIVHHWRRSTTRHPFSALGRAHIKGLIYFWLKWFGRGRL